MNELTAPILLLGNAVQCPEMAYATGFFAHDPVPALVGPRTSALLVHAMELGRARREAKRGVRVFTPDMLGIEARTLRGNADWCLALLRANALRRVRVMPSFPCGALTKLRRSRIAVEIASDALFPQREVKTPREIALIGESQRAAVAAMRAAEAMIRGSRPDGEGRLMLDGQALTSERVRRRIGATLLDHDCFCRNVIVAGGAQAADPHESGSGPLKAGETIVIDIFPQHLRHGYWGDLTRTFVKGPCPPELRRIHAAVHAAQRAALGKLRAGVRFSVVHRAAVEALEHRGFKTAPRDGVPVGFIHGTGHGVGLEIHEAPRIGTNAGRLRAGQVVTVEPGWYDPSVGGVRIEDTVVVTRGGFAPLARMPYRLVL